MYTACTSFNLFINSNYICKEKICKPKLLLLSWRMNVETRLKCTRSSLSKTSKHKIERKSTAWHGNRQVNNSLHKSLNNKHYGIRASDITSHSVGNGA